MNELPFFLVTSSLKQQLATCETVDDSRLLYVTDDSFYPVHHIIFMIFSASN